ncbi:hypothetical protein ATANTOWER_019836 [Ataeniobius toweri]|uniref:Ig-like domain-containing protein n=1 Tax=Ataeniobius toweri TaxID=208326 RepID=A0ABU7A7B2_9TELE|nr:hypothetical protein [Ataeniobius toweri]
MAPEICSNVIEAVVGLLVILSGMSYATAGVETNCDGRQDGAHCYGPLGGTVVIHLVDSASEIPIYEIKNATSIILRGKKTETTLDPTGSKYLFIPSNGRFSIRNLSTTDSGEYTLDTFDSDGRRTEQHKLELSLEAPVSSVQLVSECLSQGQVKVSCLSKGGESPKYSWTLNGHILTDSELLSGNNATNIIILRQKISGLLMCSVRTKVSSLFKEKYTSTCGLLQIIVGALGVLLIVLLVSIGFICAKRNKQNNNEKDGGELTDADRRTGQQEQSMDIQVEYGKVIKEPRQSNVMTYGNMDYSVYGNVEENVYANI